MCATSSVCRVACGALAILTLTATSLPSELPAHAAGIDVAHEETVGPAAPFVQAALDAEQAGDASQRSALLAQAVAADPDFAPARWQSGQLMFDGAWRTPEEIERLVQNHHRWADYRSRREVVEGTPQDHLELARFCRDNGLDREARYHWANVLIALPNHQEARKALDLIEYRGGLYTEGDVAQFEKQEDAAAQILKTQSPRMTLLCRSVIRGTSEDRAAALAEIAALDDPAVLDALHQAADKATRKSDEHAAELYLAIVAALGNMPQHEATLWLLNYAVYAETPDVRKRAAEELSTRRQTDYVPLLMGALSAKLDLETELLAMPNGAVQLIETVTQTRPDAVRSEVRNVAYEVGDNRGRLPRRFDPGRTLSNHLSRASAVAGSTQSAVSDYNAAAEEMNGRIASVLNIVAGTPLDAKPEILWQQWQEFNELQIKFRAETVNININQVAEGYKACFAPGTMVWTQGGRQAIETIAVGDLVLSQDPLSGELDYRPVLDTTIGDPAEVKVLHVGDERITATLGHRFWVAGRGWQMVKFLEPKTTLHSFNGPVRLAAAEEAEDLVCHNLVVEGFHTFFVGESKLLVHDLMCPAPVLCALPGSTTLRDLQSPDPSLALLNPSSLLGR
jgi:hypothetical protein